MKKIRAWDSHDKIMYNVLGIRSDHRMGDRILINHRNGSLWFFVAPYFLISYSTEFIDINGDECYFEDLVKFTRYDLSSECEEITGTAVITPTINGGYGLLYNYYDHNAFAVIEGGEIEEFWKDDDIWKIEKIGNIYQNPEQIKKI